MEKRNRYYSTNLKAPAASFREALLKGLAPDGGLYMPSEIPKIKVTDLEFLRGKKYPETASFILGKLLAEEVDNDEIKAICNEIYDFDIRYDTLADGTIAARLDQGPTASFKDFAALFMGRMMQYFLGIEKRNITILTATSGDTGSAVANAFYGLKNINVVILFPVREVTDLQRKQMTTLHRNIHIAAVDGKFDDCQRLVKTAFMDPTLGRMNLSSANSINIGRLIPQSVYYFRIWSELSGSIEKPMIFSVPSGNFGNLAGGLIARQMGLPVKKFVISTNENDEVPVFFSTGKYKIISPSRNNISSAMNVGHPSNLARIMAFYGGIMNEKGEIIKYPDFEKMQNDMFASSITDDQTREAISECYRIYGTILEPHGAVAWKGLGRYLEMMPEPDMKKYVSCFLETAHPAKFSDEIEKILNIKVTLPQTLMHAESGKEEYAMIDSDYKSFKQYLNNLY